MKQPHAKGSPRLPFSFFAPWLGALLLLSGCADATIEALQQDQAQLRRDLNALTLAVHRSRGDTEAVLGQLERRTREQAGDTQRQLATLSGRLEALAAEMAQVSARLDDLSQRVEALGRQAPAGGAAPRSGGAPPSQGSAGQRATEPGSTAEEAYQAAYQGFTRGHYAVAISGFRDFLRRFPDAPQADSAQYWIAEAYFSTARASASAGQTAEATQHFKQAVQEFQKVYGNYPRGSKVPSALYKEALALVELRQPAQARARLVYLLEHFPQSEEAPLAKDRLASLRD